MFLYLASLAFKFHGSKYNMLSTYEHCISVRLIQNTGIGEDFDIKLDKTLRYTVYNLMCINKTILI